MNIWLKQNNFKKMQEFYSFFKFQIRSFCTYGDLVFHNVKKIQKK